MLEGGSSQLFFTGGCLLLVDFTPKGGDDSNIMELVVAAELAEHPEVLFGHDSQSNVRNAMHVDDAIELSPGADSYFKSSAIAMNK